MYAIISKKRGQSIFLLNASGIQILFSVQTEFYSIREIISMGDKGLWTKLNEKNEEERIFRN